MTNIIQYRNNYTI